MGWSFRDLNCKTSKSISGLPTIFIQFLQQLGLWGKSVHSSSNCFPYDPSMMRSKHLSISYWCCIPKRVAPEIIISTMDQSVAKCTCKKNKHDSLLDEVLCSLVKWLWSCATGTYSVTSIFSNRTLTISIPRFTLSRFLVWLPTALTVSFWMSNSTIEGNVEIELDASSKSSTCK